MAVEPSSRGDLKLVVQTRETWQNHIISGLA